MPLLSEQLKSGVPPVCAAIVMITVLLTLMAACGFRVMVALQLVAVAFP